MRTYLQIDYVDDQGRLNFIETCSSVFISTNHLEVLNRSSMALEGRHRYVVSLIGFETGDTDDENPFVIMQDINLDDTDQKIYLGGLR